ncbi:S-layer protein [Candidatus Woesearchaeota archaeon]|nr:S-layer protein [Candidatus Woesearchaeota archaeon]
MYVVKKLKKGISSLPAKEIKPKKAKYFGSKISRRIVKELSRKPSYPRDIAKNLKINEQLVYYHIRNLEKAGIIEVVKRERIQGSFANFYTLKQPAFVMRFKDFEKTSKISELEKTQEKFLNPFIEDGKFNAEIIVGSPDPHGPEKARSRDGYYAIDLALFFGTFLNYAPNVSVKLDTEVREKDLENNIIVIGGPVVNTVTKEFNMKMPVKFDEKSNWEIFSSVSEKRYTSDEIGVIIKTKNPFNPRKSLLLIAGKRYSGTKAAIIAFLKHFSEIAEGNKFNEKTDAKIVEGIDMDSDGVVDEIEFLE